jgi:hypothetical protein
MAKIQGSGGLIGKRKIAILNIDSILNNFLLSQVLVTTSSKWVYMLTSVEKWLRVKRKKQWLMASSSFNPPLKKKFFYFFLKNVLLKSKV